MGDVRTKRLHRSFLQDESQYLGPAPWASPLDEKEDEGGPDVSRGEVPPLGQGTKSVTFGRARMKGSPTDAFSEEEIRGVVSPEECRLVKEEVSPYAGHSPCAEVGGVSAEGNRSIAS